MNYSILTFLILITIGCSQIEDDKAWKLIPYPNFISVSSGTFTFDRGIKISSKDENVAQTIEFFGKKLNDLGIAIDDKHKRVIDIELTSELKSESYELDITEQRIKLTAFDAKGVFYGFMTIWQQLKFTKQKTIPCGSIKDEPRFEYRGFMLDESRHFFGKEKVMEIIDIMAILKLNKFHWHLTDAPGWRIEIKSLPRLAEIGGLGNYSDHNAEAKYYTQHEIKEIVNYAKERCIEIIPEIDMPGHASAANRAYPEFSGGGSQKHPEFTFDPGKEGTYRYLNCILKEVAELFPSEYIHLGGDEVHFGNEKWNTNDSIQLLMNREGYKTLVDVEHYFMRRMEKSLHDMGKTLAGWDEVIESGITNENTLVYWWRHNKEEQLEKSLSKGFKTILCPRIPLYFDFVQHDTHKNGRRWSGNFVTIDDVYHYPDSTHQFSNDNMDFIKGIQANLWTERFDTKEWIDFMSFPRMFALSEAAWTKKDDKDFLRFHSTLPAWFDFLDEKSLYYFNSLNPALHDEARISANSKNKVD